jgi:hypothetical protein
MAGYNEKVLLKISGFNRLPVTLVGPWAVPWPHGINMLGNHAGLTAD